MGKRSQARTRWPKRHDAPTARTARVSICAGCRERGCQLITCADSKQRCPRCKTALNQEQVAGHETLLTAAKHAPALILPAGQLVYPPRVG